MLHPLQPASESTGLEVTSGRRISQQELARHAIHDPAEPFRRHVPGTNTKPFKLSILMPAYNEEKTITRAVEELLFARYPCDVELIVVDDGSTDQTGTLLSQIKDPRVIVHRHSRNRGKGAGLRSALSLASGSHILPFDADLEYSADDVPRMLVPVIKGRCDVVYGVRRFGCNTVYQSYRYAKGNRILTRLANLLFDACLSDLHTCLKLMPLEMMRSFNLHEAGFGLDTEVTALLLRCGERPFEVPVTYYSRSHAQGKKITWRDAVACVWILLRTRLRARSSLTVPTIKVCSGDGREYRDSLSRMTDLQKMPEADPGSANGDRGLGRQLVDRTYP